MAPRGAEAAGRQFRDVEGEPKQSFISEVPRGGHCRRVPGFRGSSE